MTTPTIHTIETWYDAEEGYWCANCDDFDAVGFDSAEAAAGHIRWLQWDDKDWEMVERQP